MHGPRDVWGHADDLAGGEFASEKKPHVLLVFGRVGFSFHSGQSPLGYAGNRRTLRGQRMRFYGFSKVKFEEPGQAWPSMARPT